MTRSFATLVLASTTLACTSGPGENPPPAEPTLSFASTPAALTNAEPVVFDVTCTPADCALECSVDGAALSSCSDPVTLPGVAEGPHTLRVVARWGDDTREVSQAFTVDRTAPTASVQSGPSAATSDATAAFTLASNDPSATFECSLDAAPFTPCSATASFAIAADGAHAFEAVAVDAAGNRSAPTAPWTWTLDRSVPSVVIESAPSALTNDPSAEFTLSSNEGGANFECALDGASFTACSSSPSFSLGSDGPHTLAVRAVDAAGNRTNPAVRHSWTLDTVAPTLESAAFDAYGRVLLSFDEPIDATFGDNPARYALSPVKPSTLAIESVEVSGATVRLLLRPYQLSAQYTVSVNEVRDPAGNSRSGIRMSASSNGSRVIFITQARGSGNIKGWASAPTGAATGLIAADGICQSEATSGGLSGTFRAFLSDDTDDAGCRLLGLSGKLSANCGQASPPTSNVGVWLTTDGLPLVEGYERLVRGSFMRNVKLTADGSVVTGGDAIFHGTTVSASGNSGHAVVGSNCSNWSAATTTAANSAVTTTRLPFQVSGATSCTSTTMALMCVQVDAGGFTTFGARYKAPGKIAFVSSTRTKGALASGAFTGISAADDICQQRAAEAGLANPTNFVAWISNSTQDAYCRVYGRAAKGNTPAACGVAGTPPPTGPWVTSNGFLWAADLAELTSAGPRVPIYADETGQAPVINGAETHNVFGWTGTDPSGQVSLHNSSTVGATCNDWTVDVNEGARRGHLIDLLNWTQQPGQAACSGSNGLGAILCLER